MIGRLPDVLASVPLARRLEREVEDAHYLLMANKDVIATASAASLKRDAATWAGIDGFAAKQFKPHQPGDPVSFVVCARIDLDHPIYFPDNRFADCADCGCDLQHRPDVPPAPFLCICCAARRARKEAGA